MAKYLMIVFVALLAASCATIPVTRDIAVHSPTFTVSVKKPGHTNWSRIATTRFPWIKHTIYAWSLDVKTTRTNATWFAIYQYPHPTDHLRDLGPTNYWGELTRDYSRVIEAPKPLPSDGHINAVCVLMPGEPAGYYSILVFVDYVPVYTFRYEIYDIAQQAVGVNGEPAPAFGGHPKTTLPAEPAGELDSPPDAVPQP